MRAVGEGAVRAVLGAVALAVRLVDAGPRLVVAQVVAPLSVPGRAVQERTPGNRSSTTRMRVGGPQPIETHALVCMTTGSGDPIRPTQGLQGILFTFRALSRRFYPKRFTKRTFVRRKRNKNISLSVQ